MSMTEESPRLDGRTREGRAAADAARAASLAAIEQQHRAVTDAADGEFTTPGGKRISRENRRGFGSQSQKLAYPIRPGYHRHWFNDLPGRVAGAKESGYQQVNDEMGKPVVAVVGTTTTNAPLTAYLLEIPEAWWTDDMEAQERQNEEKEETIKRGAQARDTKDRDAFYNQAQGRKLEIKRARG